MTREKQKKKNHYDHTPKFRSTEKCKKSTKKKSSKERKIKLIN